MPVRNLMYIYGQCIDRSGQGSCAAATAVGFQQAPRAEVPTGNAKCARGSPKHPVALPQLRWRHCASCSHDCPSFFARKQAADFDWRAPQGAAAALRVAGLALALVAVFP